MIIININKLEALRCYAAELLGALSLTFELCEVERHEYSSRVAYLGLSSDALQTVIVFA